VSDRFLIAVGDLKPIPMPAHQSRRPDFENLTDEELLATVESPSNGDWLVVNARTGLLYDGNGRVNEILYRARKNQHLIESTAPSDMKPMITTETLVPVEYYRPDYSMFRDIVD
jgi:hypothetical protein